MSDWNAADAELQLKKPGLLGRVAFTSTKSLTRRALSEANATRLGVADEPRLMNVVTGLAEKLRAGPVEVFSIDGPGPNALAGRTERPVVAVTRALLEGYARTELEAVVAHCLVRYRGAGKKGVVVGYSDDVRAVALTRYPPALVSALEKATPYEGRYAPLYMVSEGTSHRPKLDRIQALNDL